MELGEPAAKATPPTAAATDAAIAAPSAAAAAPAAHGDEEDDGRREGDEDRDAEGELGPRAAQRRHGWRLTGGGRGSEGYHITMATHTQRLEVVEDVDQFQLPTPPSVYIRMLLTPSRFLIYFR